MILLPAEILVYVVVIQDLVANLIVDERRKVGLKKY